MKKMMLAMVASVGFLATSAFANNIGIVDVQKILSTSPKAVALLNKLKKEFGADRDKMISQSKTLQENMQNYQKNASIMSESESAALKKKIMMERQALGRDQADLQQKYFKARGAAMNTILKSVHDAAAKVAKEKDLDMVMAKSTLVYVKDGSDITEEVLKNMK